MSRIRFNIASLLVAVLLVAVGFAALRESNETWESGLFTLTLSVLLVSILLAIHRSDARRAFWIRFALFGNLLAPSRASMGDRREARSITARSWFVSCLH